MIQYDLIVIGTGSAMEIVDSVTRQNPSIKVAVIDKDEPGGICLTRGCIPSKILLYPAELIRIIEGASNLGIDLDIKKINFRQVMERMRTLINEDINMIRQGLSQSRNIDYYSTAAEFIAPYKLRVDKETLISNMIILCTGSRPNIPPIKGLEKVEYHTSDTILKLSRLPRSIAIVGGGYIAAEYGHFLSAMGSKVTIIGRNPQFLPEEEQEISALAKRELGRYITIFTNHEVHEVDRTSKGDRKILAINRDTGEKLTVITEDILIAAGRASNSDILHPERAGIKTDKEGWILVNDYLETSQPNVWALGDANGRYLFKHVANYESRIVFYNAIFKRRVPMDYQAVPHAVFTYPEIGSVGLREEEAIEMYGTERVLIGFQRYQDTAKGEAMAVKNYFVKVIVERNTMRILGAHIIGPYASILIQEVINLMYTPERSAEPLIRGMHIHPSLSEVVERAFGNLMPPDRYNHLIEHQNQLHEYPPKTRYCPQCGIKVSLGASYCDGCGNKI